MNFEQKNKGLILKKHSREQLSILDYALGVVKVHCVDTFMAHKMHSGFIIDYSLEINKKWINHVEIIHDSRLFFYHEFYFAHHLLELLYYFLPPMDNNYEQLFAAINTLFGAELSTSFTVMQKKIILLRFFVYLGMYPEESLCYNAILNDVINNSHGITWDCVLPKQLEQSLTKWLAQCITTHPQHAKFKTNLNTLFYVESYE